MNAQCFWSITLGDSLKLISNSIECLIPTNALKLPFTSLSGSPKRMQQAVWRIDDFCSAGATWATNAQGVFFPRCNPLDTTLIKSNPQTATCRTNTTDDGNNVLVGGSSLCSTRSDGVLIYRECVDEISSLMFPTLI